MVHQLMEGKDKRCPECSKGIPCSTLTLSINSHTASLSFKTLQRLLRLVQIHILVLTIPKMAEGLPVGGMSFCCASFLEGEKVVLNVYDLSQGLARQLSSTFLGKVIEGIWHTGVVVYGKEYFFGGGIQDHPAGQTPYGKPCKVVELGVTHIPVEMFEEFLKEISPRYTAGTYSLLNHNCNNFSSEVAQFLIGCNIPDFILRLPEEVMSSPMGALILPMIQQFESILKYGGVPQAPHFGASLPTQSFGQQQGTLNKTNKPEDRGKSETSVNSTGENVEPTVETDTGTKIPPAVEPLRKNAREFDNCNSGINENGLNHSMKDAILSKDPLGEARSKVQEEITSEFATLMASGSLRASEAAAVATRRVMEKHGTPTTMPSES